VERSSKFKASTERQAANRASGEARGLRRREAICWFVSTLKFIAIPRSPGKRSADFASFRRDAS
jgi:hypothetical protein